MATWTNIDDTFLEPNKPARSADALALRDNPIAIAEGAAGAPKVRTNAAETVSAGSAIRYRRDEQVSTGALTYGRVLQSSLFNRGSSVRVFAEHRTTDGGLSSFLRVTKNGSVVQEWSTTSTGFVARTVDVSFSQGDTIEIEQKAAGANDTVTRNARFSTSGGNLWPTTEGYEFA